MKMPNNHASLQTVDTFYLLDFDRCLGNTDKLQALLQEVIQSEAGINPEVISHARHELELSGGSFDTATYIRGVFGAMGLDGDTVWQRIRKTFVDAAKKQDMCEPGASELFAWLHATKELFGIVTFGGEEWQQTKIEAAGLGHIQHLVTDVKEKGKLIASWQLADGSFLVPGVLLPGGEPIIARSLVFLDDKPVSFHGVPSEVRGICVIPHSADLSEEEVQTILPPSVETAKGLFAATELLSRH